MAVVQLDHVGAGTALVGNNIGWDAFKQLQRDVCVAQ